MDQNPSAAPQNTKQQIVDVLKNATNVLVTVSANPSVDQLSACIGLTLMLNKLEKHTTAVFSGQVPSTIEFLQPEKTLEQNTDSLRDFIISLDRSKADKLRYKIEDNVVKIFITPYRTSLSSADLQYSQGDFNVDAVVALGVDKREHLDQAITAHGRILHDATVVGVSCGAVPTPVGSINWHEPTSSSLCEMLVSISEAFQSGLLDTQMATAFLTGIVAETGRFSNEKTSPKVMTMSAQLMAAGANQQLIATQLNAKPASAVTPIATAASAPKDGEISVPHVDDAPKAVPAPSISLQPSAEEKPAPASEQTAPSEPTELSTPAPAVELGNSDNPSDSLEQIRIDNAGYLHDASPTAELAQKTEEAKAAENSPSTTMRQNEKVIAPLADQDQTKPATNGYIYEPPANGGTFTASASDDASKEVSASGTGLLPQTPMLSHDHVEDGAKPPASQDSARQAVVDAVSSADYNPLSRTPDQALNAQPVNLDPNTGNPDDAVNPNVTAPPAVAPPIIMPPQESGPATKDPTDITMPTPN